MKDTKPVTKEALIAVIASALAEFRPKSDDSSYEPIVKFKKFREAVVLGVQRLLFCCALHGYKPNH